MNLKTTAVLSIILSTLLLEIVEAKTRYREEDNNKTENEYKKSSGGKSRLSAWRIVTIVVCAIIAMVAIYYTFICYPFICKEERRYDRIELSAV